MELHKRGTAKHSLRLVSKDCGPISILLPPPPPPNGGGEGGGGGAGGYQEGGK